MSSGFSDEEMQRLTSKMITVLQTVYGFLRVFNYRLTTLRKENDQTHASGTFTEDITGTKKHSFTIILDKFHNVISVDIK